MTEKIHKACYFYNTGGCYHNDGRIKTAEECKYLHVSVSKPLEKPQHLKPPCKYYHLRGHCKDTFCVFGHSELSEERWHKYFSTHQYPGINYTHGDNFVWSGSAVAGNGLNSVSGVEEPQTQEHTIKKVKATLLLLMLQMLDDLPE
jgi:hypothetical protein